MFSNLTIAILVGIGFGGWVYAKVYRSTGGDNKSALVTAGGAALVAIIIITVVLGFVFKK